MMMSTSANSLYFTIFFRLEIINAARERQKDGSQPIKSKRIPIIAKKSYMPERLNGNSNIVAIIRERIHKPKRMTGIKQRFFGVFIRKILYPKAQKNPPSCAEKVVKLDGNILLA